MIEKSEPTPLETSLKAPSGVYPPSRARLADNSISTLLRGATSLLSRSKLIVGAILILWLVFWLRLQNLMVSNWDYDQGFYLLVAHLMDRGFAPYREIHMSEPPGM